MAVEEREVLVEREPRRRSSVGTIVAVIVGVVLLILVLMYGLPYLTGGGSDSTTNVDVEAPAATDSTTGN